MKSYINYSNLSEEEAAAVMKNSLYGEARQHCEQVFGKDITPDQDSLKVELKKEFGNCHALLSSIIEKHEELGPIPSYTQTEFFGKIERLSSLHYFFLKKSLSLEKEIQGIVSNSRIYR